jgi:hypothetical protein
MDPLHATIEEFVADGHTHIDAHRMLLPAMSRGQTETNELASENFNGADARPALTAAALR